MRTRIRNFFFPPPGSSRFTRILPYLILGALTLILFTAGTYAWDYTNSPVFCGSTCHTMPPEYAAYQVSPHARVDCVECHIGRGFVATRISRKAGDLEHVTDMLFNNYEFPIYAGKLRPARETCERCHFPTKFSDDSLRQLVSFGNDKKNTRQTTYLLMRTGGGSERQGLGFGIHWHIENEVWYAPTDNLEQDIPYVKVVNADGSSAEYTSLSSDLSKAELANLPLKRVDCITCHNRISHNILPPDKAVDNALANKQIDQGIPFIRKNAIATLSGKYATDDEGVQAIRKMEKTYQDAYEDYYLTHKEEVQQAVETLAQIYLDTNFREQKVNWETHPNNLGHSAWPGCWRCHDGQHVTEAGKAIRLECNVCHSIPQVAGPDVLEPKLPLATGKQPESHFSTLWIAMHNQNIDLSCAACHTVEDPGGTSNTSFCSNSACHGTAWAYAGLDAPGLASLLKSAQPGPQPTPSGGGPTIVVEHPTFEGEIGALFASKCLACHSSSLATSGLVLDTYDNAMKGGAHGAVILPGNPDGSLLIKKQKEGHFASFTDEELAMVIAWIKDGAPR